MWDIFGIKKRKKIKEIEEREKMRISEYRFSIIKKEYQILKDRAQKISDEKDGKNRQKVEKENSECPICKSKNVNDRIQRIQGSISGSSSGSVSGLSILGTGYISGSSYGSISGSLDTNEINKCNDCGNEWKKAEREWHYGYKELATQFNHLRYVLQKYREAFTATIDKNDLDEKFSSDEEKRQHLLKSIEDGWFSYKKEIQEFFKDIIIEAIKEIAEKEVSFERYEREWFWKEWDEKIIEEKLKLKHLELK